jgi:hypothetical protein
MLDKLAEFLVYVVLWFSWRCFAAIGLAVVIAGVLCSGIAQPLLRWAIFALLVAGGLVAGIVWEAERKDI